jgi:hypothetical protein
VVACKLIGGLCIPPDAHPVPADGVALGASSVPVSTPVDGFHSTVFTYFPTLGVSVKAPDRHARLGHKNAEETL